MSGVKPDLLGYSTLGKGKTGNCIDGMDEILESCLLALRIRRPIRKISRAELAQDGSNLSIDFLIVCLWSKVYGTSRL